MSKGYDEKDAAVLEKQTTSGRNDGLVPKDILKHANDEDEAMKAFADAEGVSLEIDDATNKRLKRLIDWNLVPILCLVYGLNFLDKTSLSYAHVMGMDESIGLTGDNYQWLGSMFYIGYLAWEYPTTRLLQRLPIGKYSAFNVFMWGVTLACFAGVQNFAGAVAVRFFLGVFESAVTPGFALITSQWYTKSEQGFRVAFWFSFNGWAQIVGGCLAYGVAVGTRLNGAALPGWRIVFLWTGLFTAAIGVVFWFVVPDNALNARFLKRGDRVLAIERIRQNQQGVGNKHFKAYQLKEALTDPMVWMMVIFSLLADIPNGGITNFFSVLITSFGFTKEKSLLLGTPGGAVEMLAIVGWGCITHYYPNGRIIWSMIAKCFAILGMILIIALNNSVGRLLGYYLTQASPVPFVAILSLISTNIAGYTKKTTVAAMYLIAYCVGNIIGAQIFRPKDAPQYLPAEITILVCWVLCLMDLAAMLLYARAQNRKKAAFRAQPHYAKLKDQEFLDLTDRENPEFIYTT